MTDECRIVRDSEGELIQCDHPALTRICRALGHCPHRVFAAGGCDTVKPTDPPRLIEVVTPEGLLERAKIVRQRYGDESCARHLELAAHRLAFANLQFGRLSRVYERAGNLTAAVALALRAWGVT